MANHRKHTASPAGNDHASAVAALGDLPRRQMAAATRAGCTLFRGFEAIRLIQQETAHRALAHHEAVAERLAEPCQPMDLLALQADLARFDVQGAALYWQRLGVAVFEMQRALLASLAGAAPGDEDPQAATPMPGLNPFFFNVDMNGLRQRAATP